MQKFRIKAATVTKKPDVDLLSVVSFVVVVRWISKD